jgi:hypothetical protein
MTTDPNEAIAEELLTAVVSADEEILQADPLPKLPVTYEEKEALANKIWRDNGAVENDPRTLNNWLDAEIILETKS